MQNAVIVKHMCPICYCTVTTGVQDGPVRCPCGAKMEVVSASVVAGHVAEKILRREAAALKKPEYAGMVLR